MEETSLTQITHQKVDSLLEHQYIPEDHLGELFYEVQRKSIFPDYRTFSDCLPLFSIQQILGNYNTAKTQPDFDLKAFVLQHFKLPPEPAKNFLSNPELDIREHVHRLWPVLTRQPEPEKSSLIPLPYPYIVPGGRFREIYYWDSYFTMLGLRKSGEIALIQNMIDNFTYLINTVGYIPNGNRTYYLSRSQPPYYALMLDLLAEEKGKDILRNYGSALRKEYSFWMDGAQNLNNDEKEEFQYRRVVRMPDETILNRYWDDKATPRSYYYERDLQMAKESGRIPEELYRDIRAACESGWDFSTRWQTDEKVFTTIHTTEIIPIDLNCLLLFAENLLGEIADLEKNPEESDLFKRKAEDRRKGILKYCWSEKDSFFFDYDIKNQTTTNIPTLAAVYPLAFKIATKEQAEKVALRLEKDFLRKGGLVTTLNKSGQQWDWPNGWAPLQWTSVKGLENYGYLGLARTVAENWTNLNIQVYKRTGKLMEKYNADDIELLGGGGDYKNQDGFGWTNGVLLALLSFLESQV